MSSQNDFEKYYKTISATELVNILDNPDDYQPAAIEAAKKEFASRKLSDAAIKEAKKPLIEKQLQQEKQKETVKAIEDKVKKSWNTFFETINPIQQGIPTAERTIRVIVIVLSMIFIYETITEYRFLSFYISDFSIIPFTTIFILLPFVLLPLAILTFWKRKPIGWILLCIFLTLSATATLWSIISSFNRSSSGLLYDFFPGPSLFALIIRFGFLFAMIYAICRRDIREIYSITSHTVAITIGAGFAFAFVGLLAITNGTI